MISLKSLSSSQLKAIEYTTGPQIIKGGPGSGKTTVLTYKLLNLIKSGVNPESILCLNFNNKLINDTKKRLFELLGENVNLSHFGTFYSVFSQILREESKSIKYTSYFSIYDTEDSESLVANIIANFNINSDQLSPKIVRRRISYLKSFMIFPEDLKSQSNISSNDEKFIKIYDEYQKKLKSNDSMDFEDLLLKSVDLFKSKKVVTKYKKIFTNILIDDFQDINKPQYEILIALSAKTDPVVVFVDENQSIFNWRGADPSKIEQFTTDYSKVKVFNLENSFRVNSNILMGAYSVIKNNDPGNSVVSGSLKQDGKKISIIRSADEKDEAYHLARFIKDEIAENKYSFDDFAILFRTQAQARTFEDVFQTEAIPFRIIGGVEYYKKKEIKDIIAYLKIFLNQHDEESLLRIMNFPQRGIGMTTVKRMLQFSERHEITLFDTMGRVFEVIDIKERIQKNVKSFKMLLDKFILLKDKLSVEELTRALLDELEIFKLLNEEANFESLEKKQNVEELLQSISIFCKNNPNLKLEDYLQTVCLMPDIEKLDDSSNKVTLMTAHSSKGLEFPVIFVSGLEEDLFPLAQKFSAETSIEEERRLFFTCVTRAKDKVYLSHARSRYRFGEVAYQNRSRFIDEIDAEYAYDEDMSGNRKNNRRTKKEVYLEIFREMEYNNSAPQSIKVGARVLHEKFGLGKVVNIVGAGENQKVTVVFEGNLTKQLMLKYAKLKVHNA